MTTLQIENFRNELVYFLRNQDIFSISTSGVTTTTATGTFSATSSLSISVTNVKNIRSIVVGSTTLAYGEDYTYDIDFSDTTIKTKITFTAAQTGAYTITYDYGSDKIWADYPRDDLSIDSYPRIAVDILNVTSDAFGIGGNSFISEVMISAIVYAKGNSIVDGYVDDILSAFQTNAKTFYYSGFIKPIGTGPLIVTPERSDEILHRNVDFESMFHVDG